MKQKKKYKAQGFDHESYLVGGWINPFEKYESNWIISPGRDEHIKYLNPPPSYSGDRSGFLGIKKKKVPWNWPFGMAETYVSFRRFDVPFLPRSSKWKIGSSKIRFLSVRVIVHFHAYGRKGFWNKNHNKQVEVKQILYRGPKSVIFSSSHTLKSGISFHIPDS